MTTLHHPIDTNNALYSQMMKWTIKTSLTSKIFCIQNGGQVVKTGKEFSTALCQDIEGSVVVRR